MNKVRNRLAVLHFHPDRIGWIGSLLVLGGLFLGSLLIYEMSGFDWPVERGRKKAVDRKELFLTEFSLGLKKNGLKIPLPAFEKELFFSIDPPRPSMGKASERVVVRLKGGQAKRTSLPSRVFFRFEGEELCFSEESSSFWIDFKSSSLGQIESCVFSCDEEKNEIFLGSFTLPAGKSPVQSVEKFSKESPFSSFKEYRWLGKDLLKQDGGQRFVSSSYKPLELDPKSWLQFEDGVWEKCLVPKHEGAIARIEAVLGKEIVLEGWDGDEHVRFSLPLPSEPFSKSKGEGLLSSLRIRSEKQISCMFEKQCLVLKLSDWVLKEDGKWRILRKKEEKDAVLKGDLKGELFIFDEIQKKQKVCGRLFNPDRTEVVHLDFSALSKRKFLNKNGKKQ